MPRYSKRGSSFTVTQDAVHTVYDCRALDLGWKQLHERLHAVEQALRGLSLNRHALRSDIQRVAFVVYIQCLVDRQCNAV